jgi:hypothetical protein
VQQLEDGTWAGEIYPRVETLVTKSMAAVEAKDCGCGDDCDCDLRPRLDWTFVVSSDAVDRAHDVVTQKGLRWGPLALAGGPVFLLHDRSFRIGSILTRENGTLDLICDVNKTLATVRFDDTAEGRDAERMARAGILRGASIGMMDAERTVRGRVGWFFVHKAAVVELSLGPASWMCNPECTFWGTRPFGQHYVPRLAYPPTTSGVDEAIAKAEAVGVTSSKIFMAFERWRKRAGL